MRLLFAVAIAFVCSCSDSVDPTPIAIDGPAIVTVPSDSGALIVEVRTAPTPLLRGNAAVELHVIDARTHEGVDGLTVSITPFMASHAHGASVIPTVTPQGGGRYLATDVALFMPGTWQLRATFQGETVDHAAPSVSVP